MTNELQKATFFFLLLGLYAVLIFLIVETSEAYASTLVYGMNIGHPGLVTAVTWALFAALIVATFQFYEYQGKTDHFRVLEEFLYLISHLFTAIVLSITVYFVTEPIRNTEFLSLTICTRCLYLLAGLNYGNLMQSLWKKEIGSSRMALKYQKRSSGKSV